MKKLLSLLALMAVGMALMAQSPFEAATNNEDGVVHLEQWQRHASRPLQAIVKLQDYSTYTIKSPGQRPKSINPGDKGSMDYASTTSGRIECPAIQAVLDSFIIESVEQLCPTFEMPREPRRSASYGGGEVRDHDLSQLYLITLSEESPKREHELIEALAALEEVEYAEPNYLVFALEAVEPAVAVADATNTPDLRSKSINLEKQISGLRPQGGRKDAVALNDPMYAMQWGLPACGIDSLLTAPKRDTSWRPIIAIIDTGVDIDHPDLAANIWTNTAEQNGATNQDDDGNGFADDVHGWDFVNQTADMHDFNSHGTHCAGIAGAVSNNGIGIAGACPDAWIMPVCVMQSDGTGDIATIVRGINYATQNGADVISMSLGGYSYSQAQEQALAVAYQTTVLVAAAGNDTKHIDPRCCEDISHRQNDGPAFPAALTFVFGVQATEESCNLAHFSNIDCDGPTHSEFGEELLYNYELKAPGTMIYSTVPNGNYRYMQGTSMACPLVAGGIASLIERRGYITQEILWGDLINYSNGNVVSFWETYTADSIAQPRLEIVHIEVSDTLYGDGGMYVDAGERIQLFPTVRTVWGPADSIIIGVSHIYPHDTSLVRILSNNVFFGWPLSSYAKSKTINPLEIEIDSNVNDGKKIELLVYAIGWNAMNMNIGTKRIEIEITNGVKLEGIVSHNITLHPNVKYIVSRNFAMPQNDTMFIKPGTIIEISEDCIVNACVMAIGKPDSMIVFTKRNNQNNRGRLSLRGRQSYCIFDYANYPDNVHGGNNIYRNQLFHGRMTASDTCVVYYSNCVAEAMCRYTNIVGNIGAPSAPASSPIYTGLSYNSYGTEGRYNNIFSNGGYIASTLTGDNSSIGEIVLTPNYYGSYREDIIRQSLNDFNNDNGFMVFNLDNRMDRPSPVCHGIVWKVEVNGYDAQDEFDSIIPLGVGTHEFKVYFNRAMDTSITPIFAMGVRPPYTQTAISENAHWSVDSTIYTAYLTLTGRKPIDGLNRIYVSGAQDVEHFVIPVENQRFNIHVISTGTMSAGFQATPGIGKVDLEWNNQEVNYEDFLGYNMYRYQYVQRLANRHYDNNLGQYVYDTLYVPGDTIRINQTLVQDTTYTDFDVVPGERYYYYYKILSTSLTENSPSKTVSCVPHSTIPGDANGSYAVDVADVITTINYVTGQNPQPFLFEAADVNGDGTINVLDIVNIINIILHPGQQGKSIHDQQTAVYTVENDTLYINTPVALAGLQFTLGGCTRADVEVLSALTGFECATVEENGNLTMIFYSMSGMTVPAGKTALLRVRSSEFGVQSCALSDAAGNNVIPLDGDQVGLTDLEAVQAQFATAYPNPFVDKVRLELTVGNYREVAVQFTDLTGKTVDRRSLATPTAGRYSMMWDATGLPRGIYFATLYADGMKAQTIKLIVK